MKECPICGFSGSSYERTLNGIDLLRCGPCSFVYADLSDEAISGANSGFTGRDAEGFSKIQTVLDDLWNERIADAATRRSGRSGKVLDIGCGTGLLLKAFKERGWECHGVDLSEWSAESAGRIGFAFFHGRLEDSPFRRKDYDLVASLSTLEHVLRPADFVRSALGYVKSGGVLHVAGVPNYGSFSVRFNLSTFHHNRPPRHCNYFTPDSIRAIMRRIGGGCDYTVRTYGIPEMHRLYNALTDALGGGRGGPAPASGRRRRDDRATGGTPRGGKTTIIRMLMLANYHAGRFRDMGDKIELSVRG